MRARLLLLLLLFLVSTSVVMGSGSVNGKTILPEYGSGTSVWDLAVDGIVNAMDWTQAFTVVPTQPPTATPTSSSGGTAIAPPPNFKVAFIGDTGAGTNFQNVIDVIKGDNVDVVVHQGDMGYGAGPTNFKNRVDNSTNGFGPNFPYFVSLGNHDDESDEIGAYKQFINDHINNSGADCSGIGGSAGIKTHCYWGNLSISLTAAGLSNLGSNYEMFISNSFANDNHIWKICSWHHNRTNLQMGSKGNDVAVASYHACRDAGAIIATGHEHSYSRTKTLTNMQNPGSGIDTSCPNDPSTPDVDVCVGEGRSFVFVSGLGGASIRNQSQPSSNYWAKIYTSDQGAKYGALIITFHVDGDPYKASGCFKNVDQKNTSSCVDRFTIFKDH